MSVFSITVDRAHSDFLSEAYTFEFFEYDGLILDRYEMFQRQTKRHKFKRSALYSRLSSRDSTLTEDEIILPESVKREAMDKLLAQVQALGVLKWSERKR